MAGSFACLYCHFIFSTKNRLPLITSDLQPRLWEYLGGIMRTEKGVAVLIGGTADHVHLLVKLDKEESVASAVRILKANSSRWVHQTFPRLGHFAWQEGYGAFSVGVAGVDQMTAYIRKQEEHHQATSFKEEFISFLKRHGIQYDERYIWR